ncbi:unnamed protein product, partial [Heterotrigona itama]
RKVKLANRESQTVAKPTVCVIPTVHVTARKEAITASREAAREVRARLSRSISPLADKGRSSAPRSGSGRLPSNTCFEVNATK